jgi:coenzyme F420-reducing hydrogenase beta subunit
MDLKYYIGYSTDEEIRYRSSSGGIGTALIKYLMESCGYGTSMTFVFNEDECKYEPHLIYDYKDYINSGSIYQDTDTINFIKENTNNIKGGIVVTCMPCQVKPIRSFLTRNSIKHFIISLCCSGQTTVQGTWCYYKFLGINKEDVSSLQYRGNGWPSGIQITLKNGRKVTKENYTYPWTLIHKSLLFRPKRCVSCTFKTSPFADVSLADPWLEEYITKDTIGNSVVICNEVGNSVVRKLAKNGAVHIKEVDENTYIKSQLGTIQTKSLANKYKTFNQVVVKMSRDGSLYKSIFTSSKLMMKVHCKIIRILHMYLKG